MSIDEKLSRKIAHGPDHYEAILRVCATWNSTTYNNIGSQDV